MVNRNFKIIYAVLMSLIIVALAVFMVIHILNGLSGQNQKLLLGGYILMLIWAGMRLYTLIKDIKRS